METATKTNKNKVAQIVTDRMIELMEQGVCPWNRPWNLKDVPVNMKNGNYYKGINKLLLLATQIYQGFESNYWLTFKQAKAMNGTIIKGSKSTPVVFWQKTFLIKYENEKKEWKKEKEAKKIIEENENVDIIKESFLMRYYNVFNVEQVEGVETPKENEGTNISSIEELDKIEENWTQKPKIQHGGNRACYIPAKDIIQLPKKENFKGTAEYYSVKWHEYGHATGGRGRLERNEVVEPNLFGSHDYSKEELVAEIFSSSMLSLAGIEKTINNNAAYIQNWMKALKDDENMLIHAAQRAQKAVDYVTSFS